MNDDPVRLYVRDHPNEPTGPDDLRGVHPASPAEVLAHTVVVALTAERDRLRDVLAAERGERGRPGWKYDGFAWTRGAGCRTLYAVRGRDVSSLWSWSGPPHGAHGTERTALEAMEAADRAPDAGGEG